MAPAPEQLGASALELKQLATDGYVDREGRAAMPVGAES